METMPVLSQEAPDIAEEYNNTLRTQSNARFLSNKQQCEEEMKGHLKTQQVPIIPPVLQNVMMHRRTSSEIELAMAGYFDASAEAMCIQLLRNLESAKSNYQFMDSFLASMANGTASTGASAALALNNPFPVRSKSFCTATRSNFRKIHDRYTSVFQSIRSSHRKVARKLKVVKAAKKILKTCLVVACGAAAAVAIGAVPHLLFFGLLVWSAAAGLCPIALKRRVMAGTTATKRSSKATSLRRLREQLDAAAKGTYVLGRDLDTVSHLVARLSNGIEREDAMAMCCVEREEERSSVLEVVLS